MDLSCFPFKDRNCLSNELILKFDTDHCSYSRRTNSAVRAAERLLRAAPAVPEGAFLGFLTDPEAPEAAAFSFSVPDARQEDLSWIFDGFAAPSASVPGPLPRFFDDTRKLYALKDVTGAPGDVLFTGNRPDDDPDDPDELPDRQRVFTALSMLAEDHALLLITAGPSIHPGKGHGGIVISLEGEMDLRQRCALSEAFPHTAAVEMTEESGPIPDGPGCLTDRQFLCATAALLLGSADRAAVKAGGAPGTDEEDQLLPGDPDDDIFDLDLTDDDDDAFGFTPLDTLDLTVRAYNALERAGIHTVEQLKAAGTNDPNRLRRLGKKTWEELERLLASLERKENAPASEEPDPMAELDSLIGLRPVKEKVRQIAAFARLKKDMADKNVPMVLNMAFTGSPGTAKTTVARITAGILHRIGLLKSGDIVEAGRGDLVAPYVGQTAPRVRDLFKKAEGRLLFIDEAYSLMDDREGSFGDEAVSAIVQEMENRRDSTVVIFAGYPDRMKRFLEWNPGLKSRVPFIVDFSDYSAEDLSRICDLEAARRCFTIGEDARSRVNDLCAAASGKPGAGNGRFARNLIESAILRYASRHYGDDGIRLENDFVLAPEDFGSPPELKETKKRPVGFQTGGPR